MMKVKKNKTIYDREYFLFKFNLLVLGQWPSQKKYITLSTNVFTFLINGFLIYGQVFI